jgi:Flp pilus assembly protein protease CpaA
VDLSIAFNDGAALVQWSVVLGAAAVAGVFDMATRQIPNQITLPLLVLGYSTSAALGGMIGFVDAAAASVLLGLPYVLLFALAGGGAGDAKIMAAIGAWLGVANGAVVLFAVSLTGAVLALVVLAVCLMKARAAVTCPQNPPQPARKKRIPYGVAVWAGVWVAAAGVMQWGW